MTDKARRREDRDRLRATPPDAGVIRVRHAATGRAVVTGVENLGAARNRFDFAVTMRSGSALPDLRLAEDVKMHGWEGIEFEVLETVPVEPGQEPGALRDDLEVLAGLWRERFAGGDAAS